MGKVWAGLLLAVLVAAPVQGRIGHTLRTTLGDGGPTIRAMTTNGGVRVIRGG